MADSGTHERSEAIAVIGMAGRFPGARNIEEFWSNLCRGIEGIVPLDDEALSRAGLAAGASNDPEHVRVAAPLADIDRFDAEYFQFTPRLAEIHDPQHRFLLEVAEEALQDAGYVGSALSGDTGVFVGVGSSSYAREHVLADPQLVKAVGAHQIYLATEKDFAPVLVAYKLGLTGPAMAINCGCSSSLVSIHLAATSLLGRECDLALAGGVSIIADPGTGYKYREGGILSPDGHCRPFDAAAGGTVPASAIGIVVLKRLDEALRDGDHIEAVILGSAINNDGSDKIGFTAPSVNGQVRVVASALAVAGLSPHEIGYIEAHGTGTRLGDPIEVAALKEVFGDVPKGSCHLGAVKSNIGHSNAASGVVGFIKSVLTVKHGMIPPTLHFKTPNPELRLPDSAFMINNSLQPWRQDASPHRAGVSSFGIGGTNAHLILEEPPQVEALPSERRWQVLPLSAKHPDSLLASRARLAKRLESEPDLQLADVAYTLQTGRSQSRYRCAIVCQSHEEAIAQLRQPYTSPAASTERLPVVLMFPGQGVQHPDMTAGLYQHESEFRAQIDRCAELLLPALDQDIRHWILPQYAARRTPDALSQTVLAQPLIFSTSYALARLLQSYGLQFSGMLGHSLGEYVAACLADVFSLEDALALIVQRARLMQSTQPGALLSVDSSVDEARQWAPDCDIAAINGTNMTVMAGSRDVIMNLHEVLTERGRDSRLLHVTRAFHSRLMEPIRAEFVSAVRRVRLSAPQLRYVSNVTGTWIEAHQAMDPSYWGEHLRAPVRFDDGLSTVLAEDVALVECGPGRGLSSLVRRHSDASRAQCVVSLCRHSQETVDDAKCFAGALGQMWSAGVELDWNRLWRGETRRRVSLPGYAFRKERYWVEPPLRSAAQLPVEAAWHRAPLIATPIPIAKVSIKPMAREMQQRIDATVQAAVNEEHVDVNAALEAVCVDYVVQALRKLGMNLTLGEIFDAQEIASTLQVKPRQRRQFQHLLNMLAEAGVLGREERRWRVLVEPEHCDPSQRMSEISATSPELTFQLTRCDQLWSSIAGYLTGDSDMREAMLAGEGLAGTSKFYAEPPEKRLVNAVIANAIVDRIAQFEPGRPARIIEIGAGTGATTAAILDALPKNRFEFAFTDRSRFFFGAARERFKLSGAALSYEALDIEKTPAAQGFAPHSFDVVVAANVLHATRNLRESLTNARLLLREGGLLVVLEATQRLRATDLTYGFLKEWWEFDDGDVRGHHPLAHSDAWRSVIGQTGFEEVAAVRPSNEQVPFQHTIFVAAAAGLATARKTLLLASAEASGADLAKTLRERGHDVVAAVAGDRYRRIDANTYSVDTAQLADLQRLLEESDAPLADVIFALPLSLDARDSVANLQQRLRACHEALVNFCTVVHRQGVADLSLRIVTRAASSVDSMSVVGATQSALLAQARRLAESYTQWRWHFVDLDAEQAADAERIAQEISGETAPREVRYLDGERWVKASEAIAPRANREPRSLSAEAATETQVAATEIGGMTGAVAAVWRKVLGIQHLDPANDFFALGGDSLTAMQLVSRLRDEFRVEIRLREFLEKPTIASVVQMLGGSSESSASAERVADGGQQSVAPQALSLEQQRILYVESTAKNLGALFSIPIVLRIRGALDTARLAGAFNNIVNRHSALRARFETVDGVARQYLCGFREVDIEVADATAWDESRQLAELELHATLPFDLRHGPLLRVQLMKVHSDDHLLLVNIHHIVADSWSIAVMGHELSAFYNGTPLPELPVQYADYIRWQQKFSVSTELEAQLRYWQQRLAGAPTRQSLPADRPRPKTPSFRGDVLAFSLPPELSLQLRALARNNGSTTFVTLLAAFAMLVHVETEAEEVLVGTDTANRSRSEFEPLIGFFINVLALRIDLQGNPDVLGVLAQTRSTTYEAFANQSVPFDRVVASLRNARTPGYAPLLQMKFLMQNTPAAPFQLGETQISSVPVRRAASELDLIFSLRESPAGIHGSIEFSTDLFDAQTVHRFADEYVWLLERSVRNVHSRLSEIVADLRRWQVERRGPQSVSVRSMPSLTRARKVVRAE